MATDAICVVCHGTEDLIATPCACRGSLGAVHAACLRALRLYGAYAERCSVCQEPWRDVGCDLPRHVCAAEAQALGCLLAVPLIAWLGARLGSWALAALLSHLLLARLERCLPWRFDDYPSTAFNYAQTCLNLEFVVSVLLVALDAASWLIGRLESAPAPIALAVLQGWARWLLGALALAALPIAAQVAWRWRGLQRAAPAPQRAGLGARALARRLDADQYRLWRWRRRCIELHWFPLLIALAPLLDQRYADRAALRALQRRLYARPALPALPADLAARQAAVRRLALPWLEPNWHGSWWLISGALLIPLLLALQAVI